MPEQQRRRFVVLHHQVPDSRAIQSGRGTHFDLMIECDGSLMTWAIPQWPIAMNETVAAESLPPHRLAYLDYEGPVSNDRGHVTRVAAGACDVQCPAADTWLIRLDSPQWRGRLRIAANKITASN